MIFLIGIILIAAIYYAAYSILISSLSFILIAIIGLIILIRSLLKIKASHQATKFANIKCSCGWTFTVNRPSDGINKIYPCPLCGNMHYIYSSYYSLKTIKDKLQYTFKHNRKDVTSAVFGILCILPVIISCIISVCISISKDNNTSTPEPTAIAQRTTAPSPTPRSTTTPSPTPQITTVPGPTPTHREDMYGISDQTINLKDFEPIKAVPKDTTGRWKKALVNKNIQPEYYALDYYRKAFKSDDEIHFIINFATNTTTTIRKFGNTLMMTVQDHIKNEELDASALGGGTLLAEFFIYLDNGDIEQIQ